MTGTGHTLTGAAVGVMCMPRQASAQGKAVHLAVFVLLANLPDLSLRNWGHDRYDVSHSVFVNLLIIVVAAAILGSWKRANLWIGGWWVIAGGALAWLSHLLLDSFYSHGKGVAIFWPFSDARLVLPIPWFSVVESPPPITAAIIREFLVEFASYFPLVLLAILIRKTGVVRRIVSVISKTFIASP